MEESLVNHQPPLERAVYGIGGIKPENMVQNAIYPKRLITHHV
jgi:hypothetical protein